MWTANYSYKIEEYGIVEGIDANLDKDQAEEEALRIATERHKDEPVTAITIEGLIETPIFVPIS